jgi:HPt (histidine-containing phosphotransfer) domain-containing protein
MGQPASKFIKQPQAAAIDRSQLARMTFGDRSLEREVLQLFNRQAELLLARMRDGEASAVSTLAHTLKSSAASIGAANVAQAAAIVEQSIGAGERNMAVCSLAAAIDLARAEIAELLQE